jgi:hypothetical protein
MVRAVARLATLQRCTCLRATSSTAPSAIAIDAARRRINIRTSFLPHRWKKSVAMIRSSKNCNNPTCRIRSAFQTTNKRHCNHYYIHHRLPLSRCQCNHPRPLHQSIACICNMDSRVTVPSSPSFSFRFVCVQTIIVAHQTHNHCCRFVDSLLLIHWLRAYCSLLQFKWSKVVGYHVFAAI